MYLEDMNKLIPTIQIKSYWLRKFKKELKSYIWYKKFIKMVNYFCHSGWSTKIFVIILITHSMQFYVAR